MQIHGDSEPARQIVFRYQAGLTGTNDFTVWHLGADTVTIYTPEGTVRRVVDVMQPTELGAQLAAETHGEIVSKHYSANLYPRSEA